MVKFIVPFEQRVFDVCEQAATTVHQREKNVLAEITHIFDAAFHAIETGLANRGLILDKESEEALTLLKFKLSEHKDAL